jgi:hypothetical protein
MTVVEQDVVKPRIFAAPWSSQEARRVHTPEAVGSNPTGATKRRESSMITCRACGRAQAKALCDRCRTNRYGGDHQHLRKLWAPVVASGRVRCSRSGSGDCLHEDPLIGRADEWDLDHTADGSHPAHADCNRSAGARALP